MSKTYGPFALADFRVGDRVEIHPACDLWMRGDRFGTVTKVGANRVRLKMDIVGDRWFVADNIHAVIE